ncbi:MAG: endonuclease/exonuclease/phosphatase family protein [bacterium]|nr:endonuclease/exonuclease/phosphatase family protein [bacterium]
MKKSKLNTILTILIVLYLIVSAVLIISRDHFILGTAYSILKISIVVVGFGSLALMWKRKIMRFLIIALLLAIGGEWLWNVYKSQNLKDFAGSYEVSFMTYNVYFKNDYPEQVIANIKMANPKILMMQEVTTKWSGILHEEIGRNYKYKEEFLNNGTHGIAVYSKYPISNVRYLNNANDLPYAQIFDVKIASKRIQIVNTHLASPAVAVENRDQFFELISSNQSVRKSQLETITKLILQNESKFDAQLLIGDLNTVKHEPIFRDLKLHWVNLFDKKGSDSGWNFPNSRNSVPFLTLDYMLMRGKVKPISIEVMEGGSSDHLAIEGTMAF